MLTQKEIDEIYPGMYDVTQQETVDIMHDYLVMLPDFGPDDKDVKAYRAELERRGVMEGGHPLCPDCGDRMLKPSSEHCYNEHCPSKDCKICGQGREADHNGCIIIGMHR